MSKAEKYIELVSDENGYLYDQHALRAVEIAKEEMIKKVVLYIIYSTRTVHYKNYDTREFNKSSLDDIINDLKQAIKDE